jgi:hypothetical protein
MNLNNFLMFVTSDVALIRNVAHEKGVGGADLHHNGACSS